MVRNWSMSRSLYFKRLEWREARLRPIAISRRYSLHCPGDRSKGARTIRVAIQISRPQRSFEFAETFIAQSRHVCGSTSLLAQIWAPEIVEGDEIHAGHDC